MRGQLNEAEAWFDKSLAIHRNIGDVRRIARGYAALCLLSEERHEYLKALRYAIRCVTQFDEFPHPMTEPGPEHLAQLTTRLGVDALEACWREITGGDLRQDIRAYVSSVGYRPDDSSGDKDE